ncbi:hypothetical protein M3591_15110 [Exiguobacterium sp. MER 193]|uniref:type IV toxin-antitoxin system AbiEi family antitoxin domain-containing protein n=1 Tax=Exiguobacterium sp. MER 193 TaxID=2939564 RepID=UPI00203B3C8C|nr:hypothetical protein [Exiguobacterium sp. MER 193]MCM3281816.1 hypothetical protein [Exiguobacterium sp. MER 193]
MVASKRTAAWLSISKELNHIIDLMVERGSVFSRVSLIDILNELKHTKILRGSYGYGTFLNTLIELDVLEKVTIILPNHSITSRYALKKGISTSVHPFEVALSLLPGSYLSHYSALFLNDLINNVPKDIYINREQSKKPIDPDNTLTQKKIDYAFNRPMRKTNQIALFSYNGQEYRVHMLNGKHTNNLGVVNRKTPFLSRKVRVTNLERTIIDCVVRPNYAGGPDEISVAFSNAANELSVNRLTGYLAELDYRYPYQNCVAFYMILTDYKENSLKLIRPLIDREFTMYIGYQLLNKKIHLGSNTYYPGRFSLND